MNPNPRTVPLVDLRRQYDMIAPEVRAAIDRVVLAQSFILGDEVRLFEEAIASRLGAAHAVGVASGSDALLLALLAGGVGRGDSVVTTPFTFFATGGAIARAGARPVFVDIDPGTFNLDLAAAREAIGRGARAIIPVHLFGRAVPLGGILEDARARGAIVVEDAAQAIDAQSEGAFAGARGDFGCLSFFPSKNLGAFGDGGMVLAREAAGAERIRRLRAHGSVTIYRHEEVGMNSRLDALQAAILRAKLPHLDRWRERRRALAERYRRLLAESVPAGAVTPPPGDPEGRHVYNQFTLRCERRDALRAFLTSSGVGCAVYYPLPLHLQPCFADLGYREGAFPEAERAAKEVLSLPITPELSDDDQSYVVERIAAFYRGERE
jgi:dTDP-4-amino-4,6-dideoxygalactose transaminase